MRIPPPLNIYCYLLIVLIITIGCKKKVSSELQLPLDVLVKTSIEINYNPYKINPLSAEAILTLNEPCKVSVTVTCNKKDKPIPIIYDTNLVANREIVLPILGFYANIENQLTIKFTTSSGRYAIYNTTIKTDTLTIDIPTIEINTIEESQMGNKNGLNFADFYSGSNYFPLYFDNNGDIRWILNNGIAGGSHKLKNGNYGTFYTNVNGKEFIEYTMTGKVINHIILTEYSYDHDFAELPNGNLLVLVSKNANTPKIEDYIIMVDRINGNILKVYDLNLLLDNQRLLGYYPDQVNDWFHHNSIYYNQWDNSMIVSGRHQGIVKIGVADGNLKWILAPHKNWGIHKPELPNYLLTAVDKNNIPYTNDIQEGTIKASDFDWAWGQHNVILTQNGNLLLFDNGTNRNFLGGAFNLGYDPNSYSRIVEYKIDEIKKTVKQIWQYGEGKPEYLSGAISGVQELDNGNRLMSPGDIGQSDGSFIAKMIEINPLTNEKVFECTYHLKGGAWSQGVYRSKRICLY